MWPIIYRLQNPDGSPLSGSVNVELKIVRDDGFFLDWDDGTFKAGVDVVTIFKVMTEPDSTFRPGDYQED